LTALVERLGGVAGQFRQGRPFYGWYIVGVAFISLFIGAGTGGFTFGIFLPAMNAELGWSWSTIVVGTSLSSITAAVVGPVLGRIVDQHGPRLVMAPSVILMAISLGAAGLVTEPWQFYLTFGLLSGIARSALQSVLPGAMIANWFQRRRAVAYGIAAMGPPCSNLLLPPVLALVVATLGWRVGWFALASVGLVVGLIPSIFILRRRPEDMGLRVDGDPPTDETLTASGTGGAAVVDRDTSEDWTAREAVHSPAFWGVAAAMALIILAPNVSIVFMFSYLTSKGLAPSAAAATVAAVSAMQVFSRMVFWAPAMSRVGSVRWMLVLWGCLLLTSTILLALAEGEIFAFIAAGVLGLGLGGNLVLQLQVWPEYFGRTAIGTIIGFGHLLQGITSATVPLLMAALLDRTGSYTLLYTAVSGFVLVGLVLHIIVGKPRRPVPATQVAA
jgi:MFS family permease